MKRFAIFLSILLSFFGVTAMTASAATLWSAGVETGNMTEWYLNNGGGEYNGVLGCTGNYDYDTCGHASDGSDSRASTDYAHTGSYSAKLSIPGVGGGVRLNRALESRTNDELLYTVWYYFPQKYTRNVNSGGWSNVMQWKSYTNVNNVETNEAIWLLGWDNTGASGAMQFYLEWYLGSLEGPQAGQYGKKSWTSPVDIPVGRWFKVETRYKKTSNFTGTVQVWQDGVLIFDKQNVRTNLVNGELAWYTTNYAEFISPSPNVIYVDDLSVSTVSGGGDTQAPTIPGPPTATAITSSSLTLTWTASIDNTGVTGYRIERCTGSTCTAFAQIGTSATNSYSSAGLAASTVYRYRVRAVDAAGNLSGYSGIVSATTLAGSALSLTASPASVAPGGTVTATWSGVTSPTVTDWIGVYSVGATGSSLNWAYTSSCTPSAGATAKASGSCTLAMPTTAGTYELRLYANNGYTLLAKSGAVTVSTATDTQAPTIPGTPIASNITSSSLTLNWTASTDNTAVTGYKVFRGGVQIGTSATNSYSDTGLTANTAYTYTVSAYDAAGNNSVQSGIASATTQAATFIITASAGTGGTIAPTGGVSVNQGSNQTFTIAPNAGYVITGVTVDGASIGVVTSYTFTNVQTSHIISATFAPIPTAVITASPSSISTGDQSTITWSSTNAASCTGTNFSTGGLTSNAGGVVVTPAVTTTYSLSCTGAGGTAVTNVSVVVNNVSPAPALSFTGGTFSWTGTNATSCTASGGWNGTQSVNGSYNFTLPSSGSYILTCTGPGGTVSRTLTITGDSTQTVSTKFVIGSRVTTTGSVNVRSSASLSASILGTQPTGAGGTIIGGPVNADGYWWWQVNYDTGADGWSVENYLQ